MPCGQVFDEARIRPAPSPAIWRLESRKFLACAAATGGVEAEEFRRPGTAASRRSRSAPAFQPGRSRQVRRWPRVRPGGPRRRPAANEIHFYIRRRSNFVAISFLCQRAPPSAARPASLSPSASITESRRPCPAASIQQRHDALAFTPAGRFARQPDPLRNLQPLAQPA